MNRRTFVIEAGKAFPIVAGAVYVIGCGSDNPGGSVTVTSTQSTVTGNHTHDFTFQGKKS